MECFRKSSSSLFLGVLVASLIINGFQARALYHNALSNGLSGLTARGGEHVGEKVPVLNALDLAGQPSRIEIRMPTVLYIFSPSCHWCIQNENEIRVLADQLKGQYQVLGISLSREKLGAFVVAHKMTFPVYSVDSKAIQALHVAGTPETLVVSQDGFLTSSFAGAYLGNTKAAVYSFFKMAAPVQQTE
jgi:hypothetical protein